MDYCSDSLTARISHNLRRFLEATPFERSRSITFKLSNAIQLSETDFLVRVGVFTTPVRGRQRITSFFFSSTFFFAFFRLVRRLVVNRKVGSENPHPSPGFPARALPFRVQGSEIMPELFCSARAKCRQSFVSVNPAEIIGKFVENSSRIGSDSTVSPTLSEGAAGSGGDRVPRGGRRPKSYARFASRRAASLA
jgi:hypothetical protein